MTKKSKSTTPSSKKTNITKVKQKEISQTSKPRGRPKKVVSSNAVPKKSIKKISKTQSVSKKDSAKTRKPKISNESLVETKVREIVNRTKQNQSGSNGKKDTSTFSLDDVRSILKNRSSDIKKAPSASSATSNTKSSNVKQPTAKKVRKGSKVKKIQTASIDDILGFGVSSAPLRPVRNESKVPEKWRPYYKNLMTLRNSLKGALDERSSETLGASAREASGELSINSSDSGTESFNRDVALSMVASEQEALEEIEDAIDRIFDGTFGICQETQKPIKKARLKVVPFTRFSLEGQTMYENRKNNKIDSGGGIFATISDSTMGEDD
ncbi:MAG: hypothetical protein CMI23_02165 [Opitutae bacterium]|nr:hypothetical protein [Opitutae bacterium]